MLRDLISDILLCDDIFISFSTGLNIPISTFKLVEWRYHEIAVSSAFPVWKGIIV